LHRAEKKEAEERKNSVELLELVQVLKEISGELKKLNKSISRVIEPEILLDHYTRGASIRIDDSGSRIKNPTI